MTSTLVLAVLLGSAQGDVPTQRQERPKPVVFVSSGPPRSMAREAATLREKKPIRGWQAVWKSNAIFAVSDDLAEFVNARAMLALADAAGATGFRGEPVWSGDWSLEAQKTLAQILGEFYPGSVGENGLMADAPMIVLLPRLRVDLQSSEGRTSLFLDHRGGLPKDGETFEQAQAAFMGKLRQRMLRRANDFGGTNSARKRKGPQGTAIWFDGLTPLNERAAELRRAALEVTDELFVAQKAEIQTALEGRYASLFEAWVPGALIAKVPVGTTEGQLGAEERKIVQGRWPKGASVAAIQRGFDIGFVSPEGQFIVLALWH